jgi:hypothetical protein
VGTVCSIEDPMFALRSEQLSWGRSVRWKENNWKCSQLVSKHQHERRNEQFVGVLKAQHHLWREFHSFRPISVSLTRLVSIFCTVIIRGARGRRRHLGADGRSVTRTSPSKLLCLASTTTKSPPRTG